MSHKTYSLTLLAALLLCCGALAMLSLSMDPLVGDLTRIGRFSENDHGYNDPQTVYTHPLFDHNSYDRPYDIVVWGDSFSFNTAAGWENRLAAESGATITAITHAEMSLREIMDRKAFRQAPPKVFIYEIVERSLNEIGPVEAPPVGRRGLSRILLIARPISAPQSDVSRPRRTSPSDINLNYAAAFISTGLLRRCTGRIGEALELKLVEPLFSSRKGDSLLVYKDDLKKKNWTPEIIKGINRNLLDMQDIVQQNGKTLFVALIIPDKLSAYSGYLKEPRWAGLSVLGSIDAKGLNNPRVDFALAKAIRSGTKDVYLPDDSHMGSAGYRIVAEEVLKYLRLKNVVEDGGSAATRRR